MRRISLSFSVENLLVIIAILMILTATFAPQFGKARNQANAAYPAQRPTIASSR